MISKECFTQEWVENISQQLHYPDKNLIEFCACGYARQFRLRFLLERWNVLDGHTWRLATQAEYRCRYHLPSRD